MALALNVSISLPTGRAVPSPPAIAGGIGPPEPPRQPEDDNRSTAPAIAANRESAPPSCQEAPIGGNRGRAGQTIPAAHPRTPGAQNPAPGRHGAASAR